MYTVIMPNYIATKTNITLECATILSYVLMLEAYFAPVVYIMKQPRFESY